jgi:hypothetical protein
MASQSRPFVPPPHVAAPPAPGSSGALPPGMMLREPMPKRSSAGVIATALALLLVIAIGAIAFLVMKKPRKDVAIVDQSASASAAPSASEAPLAVVPSLKVAPSASSSVAIVSPPPTATAAPTAAPTTAPTTGPTATTAPTGTTGAGTNTAWKQKNHTVNCDPPYTIDKSGRKHFIAECM